MIDRKPVDRDAILRKLKALRAHAESAASFGSEAEAAAFSELIQKLVAKHSIDMSELDELTQEEVDPMDRIVPDYAKYGVKVRKRHVDWLQNLATTVAHAHYCRLLVVHSRSTVVFAGRRSQARAAADVYLKLVNLAEQLANKEYVNYFYEQRQKGDVTKARGYRTSFLVGFCDRVGSRYSEWMEALKSYYAHDQKALTALRESCGKVDEWLKSQKVGTSKAKHKRSSATNSAGWVRGREKADEMDLSGHKKVG